MEKIINIELVEKTIQAICLPEGKQEDAFDIKIDIDTGELIQPNEKKSLYVSMAAQKLFELRMNLPRETIVMWC